MRGLGRSSVYGRTVGAEGDRRGCDEERNRSEPCTGLAEKRQRFCCRFSATMLAKPNTALLILLKMLAEKRQQKRCRFSATKRCRFLATCVFEVRFAVRSSPGLRGGLPKNGNVFVAVFRQAFLTKSIRACRKLAMSVCSFWLTSAAGTASRHAAWLAAGRRGHVWLAASWLAAWLAGWVAGWLAPCFFVCNV